MTVAILVAIILIIFLHQPYRCGDAEIMNIFMIVFLVLAVVAVCAVLFREHLKKVVISTGYYIKKLNCLTENNKIHQSENQVDEKVHENQVEADWKGGALLMTVVWIVWGFMSTLLYSCGNEEPEWVTSLCFVLGLFLVFIYAALFTKLIPQLAGVTYWTSFFIHIVVALLFMNLTVGPLRSLVTLPPDSKIMMTPCPNCTETATWAGMHAYPVCERTWGAASAKVSTTELGMLSAYAYQSMNEPLLAEMIHKTFGNRQTQYIKRASYETKNEGLPISSKVVVVRFPPKPPATTGTVVSFRGISNPDDMLLDASIYTIIDLAQMANAVVVPLLSILPPSWIHSFLRKVRTNL